MTALKNFFVGVLATLLLFTAVSPVNVFSQIRTPDTCPNGVCPLIGNQDVNVTDETAVGRIIINVAEFLTYIVGALSVLFLVYGGFLFVTDTGDEKRAGSGKKIIFNAVIGLVLAIVAYTIVQLVAQLAAGNIAGGFLN